MKKCILMAVLSIPMSGCMTTDQGQAMMASFQQSAAQNEAQARQNTQDTYRRFEAAKQNYLNGMKPTPSYTVTDQYGRKYIVTPR